MPSVAIVGPHDLQKFELTGTSRPIPRVADFSFLNLEDTPDAARRNAVRAARRQRRNLMSLGLAKATIHPAAICYMYGTDAKAFIHTSFADRDYWIFGRGIKNPPTETPATAYIAGPCLFSNRSLKAIATDSSPINLLHHRGSITKPLASLEADPELSFYELECSNRLTSLIADLAASKHPQSAPDVIIQIPRVQYYLYLADAVTQGLATATQLHQWIDLVDTRHTALVARMKADLIKACSSRQLPSPKIQVAPGLDVLRTLILNSLNTGQLPAVADLLEGLRLDPVWAAITAHTQTTTWRELIDLSYPVDYVRAAHRNTTLIAVEDHSEQKIYERAVAYSQYADAGALIGLYPLPPILLSGKPNWSLYMDDPGTQFTRLIDQTPMLRAA